MTEPRDSAVLALARALRDEYGAPEQDITDHLTSAERIMHGLTERGYHVRQAEWADLSERQATLIRAMSNERLIDTAMAVEIITADSAHYLRAELLRRLAPTPEDHDDHQ